MSDKVAATYHGGDYYQPPDPHECEDPDCDGDRCEQRAIRDAEDDLINRADSLRKQEW